METDGHPLLYRVQVCAGPVEAALGGSRAHLRKALQGLRGATPKRPLRPADSCASDSHRQTFLAREASFLNQTRMPRKEQTRSHGQGRPFGAFPGGGAGPGPGRQWGWGAEGPPGWPHPVTTFNPPPQRDLKALKVGVREAKCSIRFQHPDRHMSNSNQNAWERLLGEWSGNDKTQN